MMRPSRRVPLQDIGNFGVPPLSSTLGKAHFTSTHVPPPATIIGADRGSLAPALPMLPSTSWVPEERHRSDPQYVTDYVKEIYAHLKRIEVTSQPSYTYMGRQTDITEKMRFILVDWLVEVHLKYQCRPETLHLAANIVDRYLELENVARERLQLVGLVAMMLATKYEEIYPPEVTSFVNVAANTYSKDEVLRMERQMLGKLSYNLTVPTIYPFLVRALKVSQADQTVCLLANYFSELALLELKTLQYMPSCTAAAAVLLARRFRGGCDCWSEELEACTGYSASALDRCARFLLEAIRRAPRNEKNKAVYRKYSHVKCGEVAQLVKDKETQVVL